MTSTHKTKARAANRANWSQRLTIRKLQNKGFKQTEIAQKLDTTRQNIYDQIQKVKHMTTKEMKQLQAAKRNGTMRTMKDLLDKLYNK